MKKIYKRIKVNKELLKLTKVSGNITPEQFLENEVNDTIPKGKVSGVYFISYYPETMGAMPPSGGGKSPVGFALPFGLSHTDITLKDSRGHLLTEPTDIKDYGHKNGGYCKGFKELDFESENDRITIAWETMGRQPICGEFIFEILTPDTCS